MKIAELRFLVVEDHAFQRWQLVQLLADIGARQVLDAPDGQTALEVVSRLPQPVDIVVSDLDMPRMDGMAFMRHLGQLGSHVSVILTSSLDRALLTSVASMTEAYGIRLLGTIEKPPTATALAALIALHAPAQGKTGSKAPATGPVMPREDITEALRNNQFEAFFQPKVVLTTGQLAGVEALARWRHPDLGIVLPHAFIPAMESGPLINELTWIMLQKTAEAHAVWRKAGLHVQVSVNLSPVSLADLTLADRVTDLLHSLAMEPRDLVLEVTESAATSNVGHALENLSRLRMKGCGLSIDDYGTGYSSMQQLTRIAFTELKIDQSFVHDIPPGGTSRVVLESSIEMAQRLSLTSVAEGVETRADWDLLLSLHCDHAQGYLIARPMESDALPAWTRSWNLERAPKPAAL